MLLSPGEAHQARCGAAQRHCLAVIAKAMREYQETVYASHEQFMTDQKAEEEQAAKVP